MTSPATTMTPMNSLASQLRQIGLRVLPANLDDFLARATKGRWSPHMLLEQLAQAEGEERSRRSLERRLQVSGIKSFKPMADYEWTWPTKIERDVIERALTLDFLQERTGRYEHRLHTLEALILPPSKPEQAVCPKPEASERESQADKPLNPSRVHPMKGRRRAILPLIEYGAAGSYVVICPQQGELALVPDSPQWFAWLETISSLRFLGQQGRWSAYRDKGRSSGCWFAYRRMNGHQYVRSLGSAHQLTITRFEQMAATFQSYVTTS